MAGDDRVETAPPSDHDVNSSGRPIESVGRSGAPTLRFHPSQDWNVSGVVTGPPTSSCIPLGLLAKVRSTTFMELRVTVRLSPCASVAVSWISRKVVVRRSGLRDPVR